MTLHASLKYNATLVANLGFLPAIVFKYQDLRHRRIRSGPPYALYSRYARHPMRCRPNTSDVDVFQQIFGFREYRCLDEVRDAGLIVDCGANVGYSTVYFLTRYPRAKVIAVEPDPDNYALLEANVAPYGARCLPLRSAVWSSKAGLVMCEEPFGDGREWARTIRPSRPGETPLMTAVDIDTLLDKSGVERISILKIDIEGAEAEVFSANCEGWLHRVDNLVIELHGERCRRIFAEAIQHAGFTISECDELTVCRKPRPANAAGRARS
jgi:FkbM family methyltransferase